MLEKAFIFLFGDNYAKVTYLLLLIIGFIWVLKKFFRLSEFSVSKEGFSMRFLESNEESPSIEGTKAKFKPFKRGLKSLPQDIFNYFCNNNLWQHIFLTPHDLSVFEKMMSTGERENREKWFENWNKQDWWDIDFRLIQKLVNQNKKDVKKFEKRLQKK